MEDLSSLWLYQEMNQKLMDTTLELEQVKKEASEEKRKSRETVQKLMNMLKMAYQERDEAKEQLQRVLSKLLLSPSELQQSFHPQQAHPESPVVVAAKANSSITESNSLSYHSHGGSSPVDSIFEAVTSPELSNINVGDSSNIGLVTPRKPRMDAAAAVIENLAKGRALPEKGKLLLAVTEAGPLLQNLLVAGPLPRWRNPPPLEPLKIPPVPIRGFDTVATPANNNYPKPAPPPLSCPNFLDVKLLNSSACFDMSRVYPQMCSASMLNFANGLGSSLSNGRLLDGDVGINSQIPVGKRQRFH